MLCDRVSEVSQRFYSKTTFDFDTCRGLKTSTNPSVDKQIKKTVVYPYNGELAKKGNEALIHVATKTNPENLILCVRSQTQKATCCIIPFVIYLNR